MSHKLKNANTLPATRWNPERPYTDLPFLPPATDLESIPILKQCITARAALAELKRAAELLPNPSVLISTLPLLEAQASSEIENIVTTTDRLFQFREADATADPATKEALRYSTALMEGFQSLRERPLTVRTAERVCSLLLDQDMRVRRVPGVALARDRSGQIVYTPPAGETRLRDLLANWERFLHQAKTLDPLVRMAAAHYQFEAIHPFTDGNGRTGRILNSLFLIQEGLLTLPILYLSRYIIGRKKDYYRLLLAVTRDAAWEAWVLFVLKGVEETAAWTVAKIEAVRNLREETATYMRRAASKIYTRELVELIFELPYCRIHNLVDAGVAARQAAARYLKKLAQVGILQEKPVGREKLFLHTKLLRLLTQDSNSYRRYPGGPEMQPASPRR